jgi:hypothetical protein
MHQKDINNGSPQGDGGAMRKRSHSPRRRPLSTGWLRDFVAEMLAVEKGGVKLYEKALQNLKHLEYAEKLTEFLHQTEHHVALCTELLRAVGGDSHYSSAAAEAADHKAEGLLSTEVPAELIDLNNIENLLLAETKDHWNWNMLALVLRGISDRDLRQMATKAVREVRKQEKAHLDWNKRTLTTIAVEGARNADDREFEQQEAVARSTVIHDSED